MAGDDIRSLVGGHGLGFGGAPLGNLYREVTDADAAATVAAAWESGCRYFDTAPHYGLGLSERRLGAVLTDRPRSAFTVSTKVGRVLRARPPGGARCIDDDEGFDVTADLERIWDFSHDGILRSLDDSLRRLQLDQVDVVYLHDPDDHWAEAAGEGFATLAALRDEGVVTAIGVGMNQSAMLTRFVAETDIDVVMLAGRYTLVDQRALDDLLPAALARGVAVVAAGVFNSGLLATEQPGPSSTFDYQPAPAPVVERARRIATVCARHGTTLPAAALQFARAHPAIAAVVVGARTPAEFRRNVELDRQAIPTELWSELVELGLLPTECPRPGATTGVASAAGTTAR